MERERVRVRGIMRNKIAYFLNASSLCWKYNFMFSCDNDCLHSGAPVSLDLIRTIHLR